MNVSPPTAPDACKETDSPLDWGPEALMLRNALNREHQAAVAERRDYWLRKNAYYYELLLRTLRHVVEPGKRILNLRCQTGFFLDALNPSHGVGVDISAAMVDLARRTHPRFTYFEALPEFFSASEKFDYVLICDVGEIVDVERTLLQVRSACHRHTRVIIYNYNHLWEPALNMAQSVGLKIPQPEQNWLSEQDLVGLLSLAGFEWLKTYRTALFPKYVPALSALANRILGKLPLLSRLSMVQILVARVRPEPVDPATLTVSIVVPCKNEQGNIEAAVERIPELGRRTELIFCDDNSTDGTADEVRRMQRLYPDRLIRLVNGPGICKSQNVWTGFETATGDILAILDADLTVMPEELPYFVDAISRGHAEFVNGSRLIYPVPKTAMKGANMIGNKLFSLVFSYLLGQRIKDTLCGTKVLWRTDWERIRPMLGRWGAMDRWGDYDLLFGAAKLNLRILDQPVHYQERIYGTTKMTKVLANGLIMLKMCMYGFVKLKMNY